VGQRLENPGCNRIDVPSAHIETLRREAAAWAKRRNAAQAEVDWQFTTDEACTKLKRLNPQSEKVLAGCRKSSLLVRTENSDRRSSTISV